MTVSLFCTYRSMISVRGARKSRNGELSPFRDLRRDGVRCDGSPRSPRVGQRHLDELGAATLGKVAATVPPRSGGAPGEHDAGDVPVAVGVRLQQQREAV